MRLRSAFVACCLPLLLGSCMTSVMTWNKARGKYTWPDAPLNELPKLQPKPVYYALLPLTIPFDAATAPIQAPIFIMWLTMPEPEPFPEEME